MSIAKSLALMAMLLPLSAQKVEQIKGKPIPTEFIDTPWVIGAETRERWKGLLPEVNAPNIRNQAFPGQHLTFAICAQGQGRDQLLQNATYDFTVQYGGETKSFRNLHPAQIRRIKADGADFVSYLLDQIKTKDKDVDQFLSMVSLALFDVEWVVPVDNKGGGAAVHAVASANNGSPKSFKDVEVDVFSFDRMAKEGAFKDMKECDAWTMSYYQHPNPSRLLHILRMSKDLPHIYGAPMITFYTDVLKSDPAAAADMMGRLSGEEIPTRFYGYYLLKQAGYSIESALASMSQEQRDRFEKGTLGFAALPDPYDLTPDLADPMKIPNHMDMLWSHFLVTGRQEPVGAIASVLQWRNDGKAFVELMKSGRKPAAFTIEMVRGTSYMASGWSLGSFVRNHPLVADYVALWRSDMVTPEVVKEELGTLLTNEAFKGTTK